VTAADPQASAVGLLFLGFDASGRGTVVEAATQEMPWGAAQAVS
jgi:hypothetical protein